MKKVIAISILISLVSFFCGFIFYKTIEINANRHVKNNLEEAKRVYDSIPIWHKKIQTEQDLKIGIITDTHVRPNRINKNNKSNDAPRYLKEKYTRPLRSFVAQMQEFQPSYIIHLGDIIEGTGDPDWLGIMGINMVHEELKKANMPIYWTLGNHELRSITKNQFKETVGIDEIHQVIDSGDYRIVIVDGNFYPKGNSEIGPNEEEIEWLKEQLSTSKRTFVFLHYGAFTYSVPSDDNRYKTSIFNAKELQDIFREYRVDGFFNGHIEARAYDEIDKTEYFSLTGTKKSKTYPESYYELTITDGDPSIVMFYRPSETAEVKKVEFESCKDMLDCGDNLY